MWNGNRFCVYDNEEMSALNLIERMGKELNYTVDKLVTKTDLRGDHKGSWCGLYPPTLSDEGMRATVEMMLREFTNKADFNSNNEISATRLGRFINNGENNGLTNPQGFCYDGRYYYCAYRQYNGTGDDTVTKIVKYDDCGLLIKEVTGNFGHANSICYADGYLYICDINTKIYKMKSDDLTPIKTIETPYGVSAISYYNNNFYLLSGDTIYRTDDFILYYPTSYTLPLNSGVSQGFDFDGKYFYMLRTSPNVILQYNIEGELRYIHRIPLYADNVFKIGEVEDLTIKNGNIYFNAVIVDDYNKKEINSIFMTNLKTNICGITNQKFMEFNKQSEGFQLFVDNTNNNFNPHGTFSNPFPTLYEALCLVSSGYVHNCIINIKNTVINLNENIWFRGTFNNVIIQALNDNCNIKDIRLSRCNATLINLQANNVTFEYGNFNCDIGFNDMRATSSNVRLFGGKLNTTSPITLYSSTLEGVENLNVNIMDFGCHGVYKINKTLNIGESFTSDLVEKAKIIYVSIFDTNKIYTCEITKNGLNELLVTNIYTGSAGATFGTYHVTKNVKTLTFNDVRTLTIDKVATTINTPNSNYIINGLTFIL